jgi:hypothetical protein
MEAVRSSETSVSVYQATERDIQEYSTVQILHVTWKLKYSFKNFSIFVDSTFESCLYIAHNIT